MGLSIVYAKNGTRLFVDFFSLLFSFFDILFGHLRQTVLRVFGGKCLIFSTFFGIIVPIRE